MVPPNSHMLHASVCQNPKGKFRYLRSIFSLNSESKLSVFFIESHNWSGPKRFLSSFIYDTVDILLTKRDSEKHLWCCSRAAKLCLHFIFKSDKIKGKRNENKILRCREGGGSKWNFDGLIYLVQTTEI